ncbi:MAG: nucleotidyltransferase family protein, partial [Anaerolineae bacterium]|nr:nucleotidyltransferase family protein [Anaerolineae bacterium]
MLDLDRALVALIRAGFAALPAPTESPSFTDSDWARLVEYAEREYLAAILYRALKDSQRLAQLPRASAEALRLAYVRANIASWQWTATLGELLAQFARAEIPVVLLKGAALGITLYPDPALRQFGDLDVLIREQDKARAAALLTANGFTPLLDLADGFREQFGSEQCYTRRGKRAATVDLHWNVINRPAYARTTDVEWFWARTREVQFNNQCVVVLDWDAQLLHLAEHFFVHHQMRGARWSFDIALLLSLHKSNLRWDAILDAARRF